MAGWKRQAPLLQRDEPHTPWGSHNVRFSFCSLKAEADGDLRVGAWVEYFSGCTSQSGYLSYRRADEAVGR
jgi:hypothetical protein